MFLKTKILKALTFRDPHKLPISYWIFVFLRFVLTSLPQRGYIHPDEFFQNVEVVAGDILNVDVARTWEFDPKFPIRNMFIPKLILGPPLHLIRLANPYTLYYFNIDLKTPYYLLVIPRIFICLLSFINDYCLYKICILYGQNYKNRLLLFASSYVVLVYCCRSFSNSFEMVFFSLLLLYVSECMFRSDKVIYHEEFLKDKYQKAKSPIEKVKLFKLRTHLPEHSLNRVLIMSTIVVIGIFNRPTFVGFAISPIFFWLHRGMGSTVIGFKDFHIRIFLFMLSGIPTALFLILVDSGYYGYLTLAEIETLKISLANWVVTPLNFLRYNMDTKNLKGHGLHPRWLHILVNIPLLFNVLGILAIITLVLYTYRFLRGHYGKLPRIQSITGLMIFSLVIPVLLLSLFPHQEARFIIPVLLPIIYLFGNQLYANESDKSHMAKLKTFAKYIWFTLNILLTLFFGFIHQGGIYPLTKSLHYEIKASYGMHTHVVTSHSYSIPAYLLQLESTTKLYKDKKSGKKYKLAPSTFIYTFGSLSMNELFFNIDGIMSDAEMLLHKEKKRYKLYVAAPCSLEEDFDKGAADYQYIKISKEYSFYPHFATEAMPKFPSSRDQYCLEYNLLEKNESRAIDLNMFQRISCYLKRFCYRVYLLKASSIQ